jgi:YHS domain-containing protein/phenylpyruvate tautomerase PptA (4-oxalocrotonate tautomerase family)
MTLIELLISKGALDTDQRRKIGARLVNELMNAEHAPADLIERGRAMTYVDVRESDAMVGGRPVDAGASPHYFVRVSVPGSHLTDGMRAEMVARITRVLAEVDPHPERLSDEARAWVQIIEVPDGNTGVLGQVARIGDLVKMTVKPGFRPTAPGGAPNGGDVASVTDPICGMTVVLDDHAVTLERDGTTYAFCSTACRDIFAGQPVG